MQIAANRMDFDKTVAPRLAPLPCGISVAIAKPPRAETVSRDRAIAAAAHRILVDAIGGRE